MDILQTFILNETTHQVNILIENDLILFQANQIAKVLDIKNIREIIKNYDNEERTVRITDIGYGEKQTIFLTKNGIYRLLFRSNKKEAIAFRKWICNVLECIEKKGKYELKEEINKIKNEKKDYFENIKTESEILLKKYAEEANNKTHQIMMDSFNDKNVVYFLKIKDIDSKNLIKIGSTQDIKTRGRGLKSRFGCDVSFIKVFALENYENFEKFLLNHIDIKRYVYTDNATYGINNSREVFLMTNEEMDRAINIAHRNFSLFNGNEIVVKKTMRKSIDELRNEFKTELNSIKDILQNKNELIDKDEVKEDDVKYESKRGICTELGVKIQRYSADGKELLETYKSTIYAVRDPKIPTPSRNGITDAIDRKSVYVGFRWASLERNMSDDTIQDIGESVVVRSIKKGYICELNENKDEIINVYSNQKELAKEKNQKSCSWISTVIKHQKLYKGSYYLNWSDCSDDMQRTYLQNNELPKLLDVKPHQIKINRLDPITKDVLHTYSSLSEVTNKYKMTRRTLYSAINSDLVKRDYKWNFASK